jgi:hypothetical protein
MCALGFSGRERFCAFLKMLKPLSLCWLVAAYSAAIVNNASPAALEKAALVLI